ncbi:MAG: pantoate--beta-alanine ligase [Coriobacteriales bacterium]|jgi:pantoate--beta-alanine ligase
MGIVLLETKAAVREFVAEARAKGSGIGLVPTMGAIHNGHQSLVTAALEHVDTVIASVFVNPTQFSPTEDFDAYPRTLDADLAAMEEAGAAAVFAPSVSEMYGEALVADMRANGLTPDTFNKLSHAVAGNASRLWEGERRPTHFDGVTMVVSKLFNIVQPDVACFGEKDFQQLAVLRQMVADMDFNLEVIGCPIVREESGLAVSSRNRYMDESQHERALCLSRSLREARAAFAAGERNVATLLDAARATIEEQRLTIDYVEIVDAVTLEPLETLENVHGSEARMILAAYVDDTVRLIDNAALA